MFGIYILCNCIVDTHHIWETVCPREEQLNFFVFKKSLILVDVTVSDQWKTFLLLHDK